MTRAMPCSLREIKITITSLNIVHLAAQTDELLLDYSYILTHNLKHSGIYSELNSFEKNLSFSFQFSNGLTFAPQMTLICNRDVLLIIWHCIYITFFVCLFCPLTSELIKNNT